MRYYFDMIEGDEIASDEEGMELPDIPAARRKQKLLWRPWPRRCGRARC